jgi:hypothetical protein
MVDEARQWFVEVSPPSADEEGGEHAIVNPSGTHIVNKFFILYAISKPATPAPTNITRSSEGLEWCIYQTHPYYWCYLEFPDPGYFHYLALLLGNTLQSFGSNGCSLIRIHHVMRSDEV